MKAWCFARLGAASNCRMRGERCSRARRAFGYFDPNVVAIAPGGSLRQLADISWPCRLSDLWNDRREAAPRAGEYDVTVTGRICVNRGAIASAARRGGRGPGAPLAAGGGEPASATRNTAVHAIAVTAVAR